MGALNRSTEQDVANKTLGNIEDAKESEKLRWLEVFNAHGSPLVCSDWQDDSNA